MSTNQRKRYPKDKIKKEKGKTSMGIMRLITWIFVVIFFIVIPAIPGAVLWWFLKPVMFWEKFAWSVTSIIFYIIIISLIISSMLDMIYKEESEEETGDENEE